MVSVLYLNLVNIIFIKSANLVKTALPSEFINFSIFRLLGDLKLQRGRNLILLL